MKINILWVKQHTLTFKIAISFFEVSLNEVFLKFRQINWKNTSDGVHFFGKVAGWGPATLPKNRSFLSIFKGLQAGYLKQYKAKTNHRATSRQARRVYLKY